MWYTIYEEDKQVAPDDEIYAISYISPCCGEMYDCGGNYIAEPAHHSEKHSHFGQIR